MTTPIGRIIERGIGNHLEPKDERSDFRDGYNRAIDEICLKIPQMEREILEWLAKEIQARKILEMSFNQESLMWSRWWNAKLDSIISQLKSK